MSSQPIAPDTSATVAELIRIVDAIDRAVDGRRWDEAGSYFAETIRADFESLSGQPAAEVPSSEVVASWAAGLRGDKTSFHMATNHQVILDGDGATVACAGYAWNRKEGNGDPLWEVWGDYEYRVARTDGGWKVVAMTLAVRHQRGNEWVRDTPGE